MVSILDQYGQPMKREDLEEEIAGPTLGGVRSPISSTPADNLTPARLGRILQSAREGDAEEFFDLAEQMEELEPHYQAVLGTRKRQVSQLPVTVEAASDETEHKKHSDFIEEWVNRDILQGNLFDFLDAIGKGFSVAEIEWHMGQTVWPKQFKFRPQRWFDLDSIDLETLSLRGDHEKKPLAAHKYIVHRHASKTGLTIRGGLAFLAAWSFMFKSFTQRDWAVFVQNYGQPARIGRHAPNATPEEKRTLWRAVKNIAGDMAVILPEGMKIEFQEMMAKAATGELYEKRSDWMDRQVSKLVLGQTTTTDAVSGGHAVAQEHRLVQEDIERADAIKLASTFNQQLIPNMIAFNFGPQEHYPRLRIGRPDEVPLKDVVDAISRTSLEVEASWLRERIGAPEPAEGAELVGGRSTSPAQALFDKPEAVKPSLNIAKVLHSRQSRDDTESIIEQLTRRMEDDTAGAMAGLTDQIKEIFMKAKNFDEVLQGLDQLQLDPSEYARAMARGLALSHLAGQAALIDEINKSK